MLSDRTRGSSGCKLASSLAVAGMLAGCVSWPDDKYRPVIPSYAKLPFVDQVWTVTEVRTKRHHEHWPRALTLDDYKDVLRLMLADVMVATEQKNDQMWDSGMTTLVGTTAGALGALAGKVGLTNSGIGIAAGGQIGKNYYQAQSVRDKHLNLHVKLSCISSEIGTLSEFQRQWAMAANEEHGSPEAGSALTDVSQAIDSILNTYRRDLLGMPPQPTSMDDMLRFVADYKEKTALAAKKAASAPGGTGVPVADPTPVAEPHPFHPASESAALALTGEIFDRSRSDLRGHFIAGVASVLTRGATLHTPEVPGETGLVAEPGSFGYVGKLHI